MITLAESLGGYESLAELPYLMTHASIQVWGKLIGFKNTFGCNSFTLLQESERLAFGITDNLIRVSVIQSWLKRDGYETTEVSCNYAMMVAPTLSVRQLF